MSSCAPVMHMVTRWGQKGQLLKPKPLRLRCKRVKPKRRKLSMQRHRRPLWSCRPSCSLMKRTLPCGELRARVSGMRTEIVSCKERREREGEQSDGRRCMSLCSKRMRTGYEAKIARARVAQVLRTSRIKKPRRIEKVVRTAHSPFPMTRACR